MVPIHRQWLRRLGPAGFTGTGALLVVAGAVWLPMYWGESAMGGLALAVAPVAVLSAILLWQARELSVARRSLERLEQRSPDVPWHLPVWMAEPPAPVAPQVQAPGRILIVEENPMGQIALLRAVHDLGHEAAVVRPDRALEVWQENCFDLVLLSFRPADETGLELARRIHDCQAARRGSRLVAIFFDASQADPDALRSAGIDDLLVRPFRPEDLALTLKRWLPAASGAAQGPVPGIVPVAELRPLPEAQPHSHA